MLLIHDDGEIEKGDTSVFLKNEEEADKELDSFISFINNLSSFQKKYLTSLFKEFQEQKTLASRLAKIFDKLASNERIIEQKTGIIQPDHTKLTIGYIQKMK